MVVLIAMLTGIADYVALLGLFAANAAMIFLGSPKLAHATATNLLRHLYDLTRAEADLTWLLADGLSLEEAAEKRGVTLNTARSQLKRVFTKTGARRQSELVRIVLGGVGWIRGRE